jgi:hypothetical protein
LKGQEREELEEARAFSARVRGARPQVEVPPALREKILSYMGDPSNRVISDSAVQRKFAVRPYWLLLAAAAMFLVAVSSVLFISQLQRESRARNFVDAAVAEHR